MSAYTPEQFNRLPKWAQVEIQRLERNAADATRNYETSLATGEDRSPVRIQRHSGLPIGLASHEVIEFDTEHGVVDVRLSSGRSERPTVEITARRGSLVIRPWVSNVALVEVDPR